MICLHNYMSPKLCISYHIWRDISNSVLVGFYEDIVLWDPNTEKAISLQTQFQHCDSNIFEVIPFAFIF